MSSFNSRLGSGCERGATMIEYCLLVSVLVFAVYAGLGETGKGTSDSFVKAGKGFDTPEGVAITTN